MISDAHKRNFDALQTAIEQRNTALVECQRIADGATVVMVCAVGRDGDDYVMTPFAEMVAGDPIELYLPPDPQGGFRGAGTGQRLIR